MSRAAVESRGRISVFSTSTYTVSVHSQCKNPVLAGRPGRRSSARRAEGLKNRSAPLKLRMASGARSTWMVLAKEGSAQSNDVGLKLRATMPKPQAELEGHPPLSDSFKPVLEGTFARHRFSRGFPTPRTPRTHRTRCNGTRISEEVRKQRSLRGRKRVSPRDQRKSRRLQDPLRPQSGYSGRSSIPSNDWQPRCSHRNSCR